MITEISIWTLITPYLTDYGIFFGLIILALVVGITPLRYPFQWMETYYHEMSHGLACLLTFGRVGRIKLFWNGGGYCTTRGGWRIPILLAGYTGAALWGGYLYIAGWVMMDGGAEKFLQLELVFLTIATVLWVRDPITLAISIIMGIIFYLPLQFPNAWFLTYIVQFIGIYVVLNAIRAPLYLIDGKHEGDGAGLADITFIPEGVWIILWFLFACAVLLFLMIATLPGMQTMANYILSLV